MTESPVTAPQYQQELAHLQDLQFFRIKLGLDAIRTILELFNSPQEKIHTIHVAGTNGKGSVGAALVSILMESGYKAGFYSSPHLETVRERFQINNTLISQQEFTRLSQYIRKKLNGLKITYFEFTTTLAFLWFHQQNVDIAIIETGLGGRLDATNVLTPLISVITTIDYDHQQYLGDTLTSIASEKSGIIKQNRPVITGRLPLEAQKVVQRKSTECNAPLYRLDSEFSVSEISLDAKTGCSFTYNGMRTSLAEMTTPLQGEHQVYNTAVAIATLEMLNKEQFTISPHDMRNGVSNMVWPGRMELIANSLQEYPTSTFLLDGAHNEAAVRALTSTLLKYYHDDKILLIWGSMADKKLGQAWKNLLQLCTRIILTQAEPIRSALPSQLFSQVPEAVQYKVCCAATPIEAIEKAAAEQLDHKLICVAGSLYLVGAVRTVLYGNEL